MKKAMYESEFVIAQILFDVNQVILIDYEGKCQWSEYIKR